MIIKAKSLRPGSKIGLIAPAGFIDSKQLFFAIKQVERMGFHPVHTKAVFQKNGYLAGTDSERVEDLEKMFSDNSIDGVFCIRGGYGSMRILDKINYEIIRNNPKVFVGYSDITALLQAFYVKAGLVGFHGVVASSVFNDYTNLYFPSIVCKKEETFTIVSDKQRYEYAATDNECYTINHGIAKGILIGGNLSLLASLTGTEFDIDWSGKIIFIEDIGEYPYRIDRMLTQLHLAGKFKNVAGIVFGTFKSCDLDGENINRENSLTLREILEEKIKPLQIPCIHGFSFGHIKSQAVFPYGVDSEFDADNKTITIKENVVI